jgi:ribosomal protein L23
LEIEQNKIALKVSPTMSKWEIREILQRGYGLPVKKVNTVNFDGNVKRWQGRHLYRTKKWKKAIVELEPRFEGDTFGWPFETDAKTQDEIEMKEEEV